MIGAGLRDLHRTGLGRDSERLNIRPLSRRPGFLRVLLCGSFSFIPGKVGGHLQLIVWLFREKPLGIEVSADICFRALELTSGLELSSKQHDQNERNRGGEWNFVSPKIISSPDA